MEKPIISKSYSNQQLYKMFCCGNTGGMRRSKEKNTLVLISDHTKRFYFDHWEGDVFHYTGMGKTGDQSLNYAQNKTLYESRENGVFIVLFEVNVKNHYIYRGEVLLIDEPYMTQQHDIDGKVRTVWIFKLIQKSSLRKIVSI